MQENAIYFAEGGEPYVSPEAMHQSLHLKSNYNRPTFDIITENLHFPKKIVDLEYEKCIYENKSENSEHVEEDASKTLTPQEFNLVTVEIFCETEKEANFKETSKCEQHELSTNIRPASLPSKLKKLILGARNNEPDLRDTSGEGGWKSGFCRSENNRRSTRVETNEERQNRRAFARERHTLQPKVNKSNYCAHRDSAFGYSFEEMQDRREFIKWVYLILFIQLLFTFGYVIAIFYVEEAKNFFRTLAGFITFIVVMIFEFIVLIILVCCGNLRRIKPWNYILLGIFTACQAFVLGYTTSFFDGRILWMALGVTILVVALISLIAVYSPIDITGWGLYLIIATVVLMVFGLIAMLVYLFTEMRILYVIYAGIGVLLFSMWLIYDTQMIVGGRSHELESDEYVAGALTLYIDIVQIFTFLIVLLDYCQ